MRGIARCLVAGLLAGCASPSEDRAGLTEDTAPETCPDGAPALAWFPDADLDGWGDALGERVACGAPAGFVLTAGDCDDADPTVYPAAPEVCDLVDQDCDGQIDEETTATWFFDADGDGWGDDGRAVEACAGPEGFVEQGGDCDDADAGVHPFAEETDCAGDVDLNCDGSVGDEDADADGFTACEDCDDRDRWTNPGGVETCDGRDEDCDGATDELAADAIELHHDADGDHYGDPRETIASCDIPDGWVPDGTDCDDSDETVNPGRDDADCDDVDDDCDGTADQDGVGGPWYADDDGDRYGDPGDPSTACDAPAGFLADASDCDDADETVNPDATETCDGADEDCDGVADDGLAVSGWYVDADGDGYGDPDTRVDACGQPAGYVAEDGDCDDASGAVHPGATELCNGEDDDCDGRRDEGAGCGDTAELAGG